MDLFFLGIIFVLILVLLAEFINGWTDAPNAIATVVTTGTLSFTSAKILAVVGNFVGAFFGTAVAATIGKGIVDASVVNLPAITGAMIAIVCWGGIAAKFGLPISKSHALLAGLAGAAYVVSGDQLIVNFWTLLLVLSAFVWLGLTIVYENQLKVKDENREISIHIKFAGFYILAIPILYLGSTKALLLAGWIKVGYGMILSVLITFPIAYLLGKLIIMFFSRVRPAPADRVFRGTQILASAWMAFGHGMNDAQKFVGVIMLVMFTTQATVKYKTFEYLASFGSVSPNKDVSVYVWVIVICAVIMAAGTMLGGRKIIEKVGTKMVVELKTWQGCAATISASSILTVAGVLGIPLSTTHTNTSGVLGAAASQNLTNVRWPVFLGIFYAWIMTFLVCSYMGALGAHLAIYLSNLSI